MAVDKPLVTYLSFLIAIVILVLLGPLYGDLKSSGTYNFLKDWQSLIAGLIAIAAAYVTVRPVWKQLEEMRKQSLQTHLSYLRNRSTELQREFFLCTEIMANSELLIEQLDRPLDLIELRRLETHYRASVDNFRERIGPAWGSRQGQAVRSNFHFTATLLGNSLATLTRSTIVEGIVERVRSEVQTAYGRLTKCQAVILENIDKAEASISERIEKIEQQLMN